MDLVKIIKKEIEAHGPMNVGQFMGLALGHPKYGYYMKKDPFGVDGDFTTAPEVSQMFGEMIGAWVAQCWIDLGRPARFSLLECGPGRGTLMADLMRATAGVEGFHAACGIHLLEMSPVLKNKQAEALVAYEPRWHDGLESVPGDVPVIVIGNEFLDALPVRQFVVDADGGWAERMVGFEDGAFGLVLQALPENVVPSSVIILHNTNLGGSAVQKDGGGALQGGGSALQKGAEDDGAVYEHSEAVEEFVRSVCALVKRAGGAGLFIDYGYLESAAGETLQAVYKHEYCGVLERIGDADITAHVDFEMAGRVIGEAGLDVFGPVEQGTFLKMFGIEERAAYLKGRADEGQRQDIDRALYRLTDSGQMGQLFKVIGFNCLTE